MMDGNTSVTECGLTPRDGSVTCIFCCLFDRIRVLGDARYDNTHLKPPPRYFGRRIEELKNLALVKESGTCIMGSCSEFTILQPFLLSTAKSTSHSRSSTEFTILQGVEDSLRQNGLCDCVRPGLEVCLMPCGLWLCLRGVEKHLVRAEAWVSRGHFRTGTTTAFG